MDAMRNRNFSFRHPRRPAAWRLPCSRQAGKAFAQAPQSKFADVNGVRLHYLVAGKGDPVVLLHGYAETSHMWLPLIAELSDRHTVIAPDLRGFGESSAPPDGYTKAAMAQDIHALVKSLATTASGSSATISG